LIFGPSSVQFVTGYVTDGPNFCDGSAAILNLPRYSVVIDAAGLPASCASDANADTETATSYESAVAIEEMAE
jgi:hypothetical protein